MTRYTTVHVFCFVMVFGISAHASDSAPSPQRALAQIDLDSVETSGLFSPKPVKIKGYLLTATSNTKAPAAVLVPACSGLLTQDGSRISPNYQKMAHHLHSMGMTVLLIDGFNPRGFKEICSLPSKQRAIDTATRLKDSLGGLNYLRSRDDVLADQIYLVSWGATGGLQVMNKGSSSHSLVGAGFAGAVMFYPECDKMDHRFAPYAPIQVFVGDKDEWNPAAACLQLAKRQETGSAAFEVKVYPDTYHAFDKPFPPRLYTGNSGLGTVMVGSNPSATEDAFSLTKTFLTRLRGASLTADGR